MKFNGKLLLLLVSIFLLQVQGYGKKACHRDTKPPTVAPTPSIRTPCPTTPTPDVTTPTPDVNTPATTAPITPTPDVTTDAPATTTPITPTPDVTTDAPATTTPITPTPDVTTDAPATTTPITPAPTSNNKCEAMSSTNSEKKGAINIIIVPSGFNGDEKLFREKSDEAISVFKNHDPLNFETIKHLNVWRVFKDKGTYCAFGCNGIDRLLCCTRSIAESIADECGPDGKNHVVTLHNSNKYGGAGYKGYATVSTNIQSRQVLVHELGHSLFGLGDEYDNGLGNSDIRPNCEKTPTCKSWSSMIGLNGVDCNIGYCSGAKYYGSQTTLMRFLGRKFHDVNERISCCAHLQLTSKQPAFCNRFSGLESYCSSITIMNGFPSSKPNRRLLVNPVRKRFLVNENSEWKEVSSTKLTPGSFEEDKLRTPDQLHVVLNPNSRHRHRLLTAFASPEDVEFPMTDGESLGGYVKVPQKDISIIVDEGNEI